MEIVYALDSNGALYNNVMKELFPNCWFVIISFLIFVLNFLKKICMFYIQNCQEHAQYLTDTHCCYPYMR
jgi:hypothetical protein